MNLFSKCFSIATALTLSVCSLSVTSSFGEEKVSYTLSFDLDGAVCEDYDFPDMTIVGSASILIPEGEPKKDGYYFSGWTYDNHIMYEENDSFQMPEQDTVLVPVWFKKGDKDFHTTTYDAGGGEFLDPQDDVISVAGRCIVIPKDVVEKAGYQQCGWTDGEYIFQKGQKMIAPSSNLVLYPVWKAWNNVNYFAGDYDDIVGGNAVSFEKFATQSFELPDNTRFSRRGYALSGWHCENDGKDYLTNATYIMPDEEAFFTAIWRRFSYNIKFSASTSQVTKVKASYGDTITIPECEFTKSGYVFAGWTYKGKTYFPNDRFEIPALLRGETISFGCKWVKESDISDEQLNCFSLIEAKRAYKNGKITLDELQKQADFLLCK